ncbi:MAG: dynamin family protein [Deltaproteobacteria bacterium]|nr:dynamin family protein [Deltaproteobacteria bacterium]
MSLLARHSKTKRKILYHLRWLATIAEDVGMDTLASDINVARIPKVENERFFLVILGEFNHGKSTFVNALLGAEVLPTGITPTTATINHVQHAAEPSARAFLRSGETIDLTPGALADWVTVAGDKSKDVSYVELGYPAEVLEGNVTLVDTPGVNDLNEQRADITYGYVPRADAVIFLLDAGQALKDSEREFLSSHVLEGSKDRMIFVLGKVDLLSDSDRKAVFEYVKKGLAKLIDEPVVFPISAKAYLEGKKEESNMGALHAHLERFLDTDRAQILLDNAATDTARTAAYLLRNLTLKQRALELDLGELERRVEQVRSQLDASKRTLDKLHERIRADSAAIRSQVRLDLDNFARKFAEIVPGQIDSVDANDVKSYLGGFIEDKFKEWAELEGAKVAAMLEKLAEEVIAVTNENVAAASAALANRLGPADTEVDIDVDTLKYDLGVYAVGLLGTAVFFVNTLAGGLLTLTAPILSIVVKSRVAGDIREQAKKQAPEVIHRAADAMGPHFDRCVEDFGKRLSEFVTTAGNTLYKGISELLEQTIAERRERAGELDPLRDKLREQIARVEAGRAELEGLRSEVWKDDEATAESEPNSEPKPKPDPGE